ncbi:WbqC-like protein [Mucilaginibacter yixingensis]|uniref:WbqC-like protein n=1 Tax=Mucilaginibacter yixingensis TaxID=1295612 RepID=A0A2T5JA37_9SPHI|nr:WbqC family protein [Mucilaginibacter yixingensis]PTQ96943.1 WbqC-like protein [Mucilaginibacter yixingensis]
MTENGAVFPMFYLPPVQYFSLLYQHRNNILIEKDEHLIKQTYRNRAHIYSPDGLLSLVVPVIKGSKVHTQMKDVRISYDFNWQRLHWMSLQGCYRRSAYFEYYEADFVRFYEEKFEFLFDYNEQLLNMIIGMTKMKTNISLTETYERDYPDMADYRMTFSAKKEIAYEQKPYFQVFEERKGFMKNLSIVDLLFNQGPQTLNYL